MEFAFKRVEDADCAEDDADGAALLLRVVSISSDENHARCDAREPKQKKRLMK